MQKINIEDIHLISRHSNWSKTGAEKALIENVYNDTSSWRKFLQLFTLSLGVGFMVLGILFFFAYNWADIHKFTKIGMIEVLILVTTLLALVPKFNPLTRNILLTGASVLVGVLFAVFGQIYQTGANAYDFFLGWSASITLWVIIANFPALWLIYITLLNTTLSLYAAQVTHNWTNVFLLTILFVINVSFLVVALGLSKLKPTANVPGWFTKTIALASVYCCTSGVIQGVFGNYNFSLSILIALIFVIYGAGVLYGLREKSQFYLAIIAISVIIMITSCLAELTPNHDTGLMTLLIGVFIITSVTVVVKTLLSLQKKWNNEQLQ